jgi:hypothetical protein
MPFLQFSLRTIFVAVTSSALAFGVFAYCRPHMDGLLSLPGVVGAIALCVPCVWVGMALFSYGCGAQGQGMSPVGDAFCAILVICGFSMAYGAIFFAAMLLILFTLSSVLMTGHS